MPIPSLYIINSHLHALIALLISEHHHETEIPHFAFVRFPEEDFHQYEKCLSLNNQYKNTKFLFFEKPKKNRNKKFLSIGRSLSEFANNNGIEKLYLGNDRHSENQFLVRHHSLDDIVYIDDGLYSYDQSSRSSFWSEHVVDQALKKLFVGWWYKTPPYIGGSDFFTQSYVFIPELTLPKIQTRPSFRIPTESSTLRQLADCMISAQDEWPEKSSLNLIIAIPDEKNIDEIDQYAQKIINLVKSHDHGKVAIKYHPNTGNRDPLHAREKGLHVLPATVPFEFIALNYPEASIVSEYSTTLITSKLLNPNQRITTLPSEKNAPGEYQKLLDYLGVRDCDAGHHQSNAN